MSGRGWLAGLAAVAAVTVTSAACGTVTTHARPPAPPAPAGLATSLAATGGDWAVLVLGGSAARGNNFWQVFARPAGSAAWRLATPPGVASNGGLVLASLGGRSVLAGFRPSQDLVFSPLASTTDDGASWSSGVLDAGLADVPDALAAAPGGGRLLALLADGEIDQAGPGAAAWSRLASLRSLDSAPAGRRCSPRTLTAVSFSPSGAVLAAGTCTRPGVTGIFSFTPAAGPPGTGAPGTGTPGTGAQGAGAQGTGAAASGGTWRAAGPAPPARLAGGQVQVLRLTRTPAGEVALLTAGSGRSTVLLAAWTSDGTHWTVSAPLGLGAAVRAAGFPAGGGAAVRAAGFSAGAGVAVLLASGQAATIDGPAARWQPLPRPPARTAVLAFSLAGGIDALAPYGSRLTVWRLARGSAAWHQAQSLNVPIQYGSSG